MPSVSGMLKLSFLRGRSSGSRPVTNTNAWGNDEAVVCSTRDEEGSPKDALDAYVAPNNLRNVLSQFRAHKQEILQQFDAEEESDHDVSSEVSSNSSEIDRENRGAFRSRRQWQARLQQRSGGRPAAAAPSPLSDLRAPEMAQDDLDRLLDDIRGEDEDLEQEDWEDDEGDVRTTQDIEDAWERQRRCFSNARPWRGSPAARSSGAAAGKSASVARELAPVEEAEEEEEEEEAAHVRDKCGSEPDEEATPMDMMAQISTKSSLPGMAGIEDDDDDDFDMHRSFPSGKQTALPSRPHAAWSGHLP